MLELVRIFVDVLTPVVAVAAVGAFAAKRWSLDYRPLSTIAYNFLAPAFIFRLLSAPTSLDGPVATMIGATLITLVVMFGLTWVLELRQTPERRLIDAMTTTFGNVGNLGFPIVLFALGSDALPEAGVHFLAVTTGAFVLGIGAAAHLRSRSMTESLRRMITTPALAVVLPAVLLSAGDVAQPQVLTRFVDLLAEAMIPAMLLTLGMQLVSTRLTSAVSRLGLISVLKLVIAPLVFFGIASALGLSGDAMNAGLLLAAMPTAVLVGLISLEYDLESEVASAAILVTSAAALVTVGLLLTVL